MEGKDEAIQQLLNDYKANEETIGALQADLKKLSYQLDSLAGALRDSLSAIEVLPDALRVYGQYGERPTIPNQRLDAEYVRDRVSEFLTLMGRKAEMRGCLKQMGFDSMIRD